MSINNNFRFSGIKIHHPHFSLCGPGCLELSDSLSPSGPGGLELSDSLSPSGPGGPESGDLTQVKKKSWV